MVRSCSFIVSAFVCVTLFAGSVERLDVASIGARSTLIVTGTVTAVKPLPSTKGLSIQIVTVKVASVMKGVYRAATLTIRTRQGLVHFDRDLRRGDAGVFFLREGERGNFELAHPAAAALFERLALP